MTSVGNLELIKGDGWLALDGFWQEPAATEKHAFAMFRSRNCKPSNIFYLGIPWANFIDLSDRRSLDENAFYDWFEEIKPLVPQGKRVVTVCQHIQWRRYADEFSRLGVTDIFASHAWVGEFYIEQGISVFPFPLYPVVQPRPADVLDNWSQRDVNFAFTGAYNKDHYISRAREYIFGLSEHQGAFVKNNGEQWHLENQVYKKQIAGVALAAEELEAQAKREDSFADLMVNTKFSLCPSGTGVNSIRLWESLLFQSVPVIIADDLALPGGKWRWDIGSIRCGEDEQAIASIPSLIDQWSKSVESSQTIKHVAALAERYGPGNFVQDIVDYSEVVAFQVAAGCHSKTLYLDCTKLDQASAREQILFFLNLDQLLDYRVAIIASLGEGVDLDDFVFSDPRVHTTQLPAEYCAPLGGQDVVIVGSFAAVSFPVYVKYSNFLITPAQLELESHHHWVTLSPSKVFNGGANERSRMSASLITSVFKGDDFIDHFLSNMCALSNYSSLEHLIFLAKSTGRELRSLLPHVAGNKNSVLICLAEDPGLYDVWNLGVNLSSTPVVSNANIDDLRMPHQMSLLVQMLADHQDVSVVSGGLYVTDEKNSDWRDTSNLERLSIWYGDEPEAKYGFEGLYRVKGREVSACNKPHCMPVWRKRLHVQYGGFDERQFGPSADWEFWLRAAFNGTRFSSSSEPLGIYLRNESSYWRSSSKIDAFERNIKSRWGLIETGNSGYLAERESAKALRELNGALEARDFVTTAHGLLVMLRNYRGGSRQYKDLATRLVDFHLGCGKCLEYFEAAAQREAVLFRFLIEAVSNIDASSSPHKKELVLGVCLVYQELWPGLQQNLLLARVMGRCGFIEGEVWHLTKLVSEDPKSFWDEFQGIYRFDRSVTWLASNLPLNAVLDAPQFSKILFLPDYTHGNAYQTLLYQSDKYRHAEIFPVELENLKDAISCSDEDQNLAVDVHWLNFIFKGSPKAKHLAIAENFMDKLSSVKSPTVRIRWHIHNAWEHDDIDRQAEMRLRKALVEIADSVIVHHPSAILHFDPSWFDGAEGKITVQPHGAFPRVSALDSKTEARSFWGLGNEQQIMLIFGQLRPYKALHLYWDRLLNILAHNNDLCVVVAGNVACEETRAALSRDHPQVRVIDRFLADEELEQLIIASDVCLLTYRSILMSGAIHQALGLGRPVIAPSVGLCPTLVADGHNGWLYNDHDFTEVVIRALQQIESNWVRGKLSGAASSSLADFASW